MKKIILMCLIILTGCSTYDVSIITNDDEIINHQTAVIYTPDDIGVLEYPIGLGYSVISLIYPFPYIKTDSKQINGGNTKGFAHALQLLYRLSFLPGVEASESIFYYNPNDISFIDSKGKVIIYKGNVKSYKVETNKSFLARKKTYFKKN